MDSPSIWGILLLVTLGTYVWRAGGVLIAQRIEPGGALAQWFSCVAYGMLAALISRIMVLPVGILAETPLGDRLGAMAAGYLVFFACKRSMLPGIVGAVSVFVTLAGLRWAGIL